MKVQTQWAVSACDVEVAPVHALHQFPLAYLEGEASMKHQFGTAPVARELNIGVGYLQRFTLEGELARLKVDARTPLEHIEDVVD